MKSSTGKQPCFNLFRAGVFNLWSADPRWSAGSFQGVRGQPQKNWRPVAFKLNKNTGHINCRYRLQRTLMKTSLVFAMLCLKSELDWASLTYYLCSQSLTHVLIILLTEHDVTATSLLKILQCARLDDEHDIRVGYVYHAYHHVWTNSVAYSVVRNRHSLPTERYTV